MVSWGYSCSYANLYSKHGQIKVRDSPLAGKRFGHPPLELCTLGVG